MAGTCLALLEPDRFVATGVWVAAFAARVGAALAAEAAMVFFRAAGSGGVAVDLPAEWAALASLALRVDFVESLPVAFFSPVVFAIAIPSLLEAGYKPGRKQKQTAENLLL
ncbi:hypothetical protein WJ542_22155 [Paraburkholderia sp. B3]|uniref:hypothetical protein n=1 Tax=Paraburkholderia sp. B3 TaxID=3134791 RepID=UPI0039828CF7